jgi:hypothetical protein
MAPPGDAKAGMVPWVVATRVESAGADAGWLDAGGLLVLVVGGTAAPAIFVLVGRGLAALRVEWLHAEVSRQIASAMRAPSRTRRLTSPAIGGRRS